MLIDLKQYNTLLRHPFGGLLYTKIKEGQKLVGTYKKLITAIEEGGKKGELGPNVPSKTALSQLLTIRRSEEL